MLRVAIKGVLARKLRLLLTSIAVVLGVGFVAGAFFLTDSMRDSFDDLFTVASEGIDVHIQSTEYKELVEQQATSAPGTISIDLARVGVAPEVIEQVSELDGVDQVAGSIFEFGATVLGKDGKPIQSGGRPRVRRELGRRGRGHRCAAARRRRGTGARPGAPGRHRDGGRQVQDR